MVIHPLFDVRNVLFGVFTQSGKKPNFSILHSKQTIFSCLKQNKMPLLLGLIHFSIKDTWLKTIFIFRNGRIRKSMLFVEWFNS